MVTVKGGFKSVKIHAMVGTIKGENVLWIYTFLAKTYKFHSTSKPFPGLKFVSKLLSFWLMMSLSVGKSKRATDNHATWRWQLSLSEGDNVRVTSRGMWRHWRHQGPPKCNRPCCLTSCALVTSWRRWRHARRHWDVRKIAIEVMSMPNFEFWKSDHYWGRYGRFC